MQEPTETSVGHVDSSCYGLGCTDHGGHPGCPGAHIIAKVSIERGKGQLEMPIEVRNVTIVARDGFPLAATLFNPSKPAAFLTVASALGVPRKHYARFASYILNFGIATVTFDYRGIGDSGPAWRKDAKGGLTALGRHDLDSVLNWTQALTSSQSPLCFIGHSLGTVAFGLAPGNRLANRVISVASGNCYSGLQPFPYNIVRSLFWSTIVPHLTRMHGYFPGSLAGLKLGNLPTSIAIELAQFCKSPDFVHRQGEKIAETFSGYQGNIWALSFTDDRFMSQKAVDELHTKFSTAVVKRSHFSPCDFGLSSIGHFGAFKHGSERLWDMMAKWLLEAQGTRSE
jgi:predicted alpha/beta hydrolase